MNGVKKLLVALFVCSIFAAGTNIVLAQSPTSYDSTRAAMLQQIEILKSLIVLLQQQLAVMEGFNKNQLVENNDTLEPEVETILSAPGKNYFYCKRDTDGDQYSVGQVACYGLWDYGNSFGGDRDMCPGDYTTTDTGCGVAAPVCKSGLASASRAVAINSFGESGNFSKATVSDIATIAKNLRTSSAVVRKELITVWEYKCADTEDNVVSEETEEQFGSIWEIPKSAADILVVGVYEGGYPSGVSHSGGSHPEGEVTVDVNSTNGYNTLLVLNAYEPVHWKITGTGAQYLKGILVTGYHDQRVSGIGSDVEVQTQTHANGAESGEYFIIYNGQGIEDDEFPELVDYIQKKTGFKAYIYNAAYAEDFFRIGVKG